MHLKILGHPIFTSLNFHMPMIVDLSHPLVMLQGENGAGKSTLLHSIFYALRGDKVDGYIYRLETGQRDIRARPIFSMPNSTIRAPSWNCLRNSRRWWNSCARRATGR